MDKAHIAIRRIVSGEPPVMVPALVQDGVAVHRSISYSGDFVGNTTFNVTHVGGGVAFAWGLEWDIARKVQAGLAAQGWGDLTVIQIFMLPDWPSKIRKAIKKAKAAQ